MKFDAAYEDVVLSQSLRNVAFLKEAAQICESHHFCTKERSWLWNVIQSNWTKHRELTSSKIIVSRAKIDFEDPVKRKPYLAQAKKVFRKKVKNPKTVLAELERFVRYVNIQVAIEETALHLEKNQVDEAEKTIAKRSRTIVRRRKYTHIQWIEGFKERQGQRKYERDHPDEFTSIPLGFPAVDKCLSGGGRRGELGLIVGNTGRGKSVFLTNAVMSCIQHGYKAIYLGFEMPARQIASRQDSRWSGLRYSQFKDYEFKPSELMFLKRKFKKAKKTFDNALHIISFPVRSANIFDVRNAIEDIQDKYQFKADGLFFDSLDHLKSLQTYGGNFRLQQAEVYWSGKEIAEEDGYFVMTSSQAGKEWVKRIATAEAPSESYDKSRIADLVMTLNDPNEMGRIGRKTFVVDDEDDEDEENDEEIVEPIVSPGNRLIKLNIGKYRDGESKYTVDMECDFARMRMKEITQKEKDDE